MRNVLLLVITLGLASFEVTDFPANSSLARGDEFLRSYSNKSLEERQKIIGEYSMGKAVVASLVDLQRNAAHQSRSLKNLNTISDINISITSGDLESNQILQLKTDLRQLLVTRLGHRRISVQKGDNACHLNLYITVYPNQTLNQRIALMECELVLLEPVFSYNSFVATLANTWQKNDTTWIYGRVTRNQIEQAATRVIDRFENDYFQANRK